jgi:peptidoglycan-N-acetylglucosamine deacetylase
MHDGGGNRAQTVAALGTVLASLSARGFHFAALCRG